MNVGASTWITLVGCAVAVLSLVFSRRDRQSEKSVREFKAHQDELDRLSKKIDDNEREIGRLRRRVSDLEHENEELRNENMRLMKIVINCPSPECPVLAIPRDGRPMPLGYRGTERRSSRDVDAAWAEGVVQGREMERRETGEIPKLKMPPDEEL